MVTRISKKIKKNLASNILLYLISSKRFRIYLLDYEMKNLEQLEIVLTPYISYQL